MVLASLVVGVFAILASSLGAYLAGKHALINSADDTLQSNAALVADAAAVHIVNISQSTGVHQRHPRRDRPALPQQPRRSRTRRSP